MGRRFPYRFRLRPRVERRQRGDGEEHLDNGGGASAAVACKSYDAEPAVFSAVGERAAVAPSEAAAAVVASQGVAAAPELSASAPAPLPPFSGAVSAFLPFAVAALAVSAAEGAAVVQRRAKKTEHSHAHRTLPATFGFCYFSI